VRTGDETVGKPQPTDLRALEEEIMYLNLAKNRTPIPWPCTASGEVVGLSILPPVRWGPLHVSSRRLAVLSAETALVLLGCYW
jgi:hypothetical protein